MKKTLMHQVDDTVKQGFEHFISPLATELDLLFCEILLAKKANSPFLTLECIPLHEEVASDWSEALRDRFFYLLEVCDRDHFFTLHPYPGCVADYAKELVSKADQVLIHGDNGLGLPFLAARCAKEAGIPVQFLNLAEAESPGHTYSLGR